MRAQGSENGLRHFLSATGHNSLRILCAGRLLNYDVFGGGETGDKEVD
jgi:hypothetical protein